MTESKQETQEKPLGSESALLLDYAYSLNKEVYSDLETIMDKVNSDYEKGVEVTVYKGEKKNLTHSDFINIDEFFESLHEAACDECGEWAEDYMFRIKSEQRDELKKVISEWMGKNFKQPEFLTVDNITEYTAISKG